MARWRPLEAFLLELRREGRDAYRAAHPHPVFVIEKLPDVADHGGDSNTEDITSSRLELAAAVSREQLRLASRYQTFRVLTVVKCEDNDFPDRITLGRARNNDMVVPHRTVSKVHAYFTTLDDGRATLTDFSSRNGTRLNDARLKSDRTATLESGDKLTFGAVTGTYYSSRGLCDFLSILLDM